MAVTTPTLPAPLRISARAPPRARSAAHERRMTEWLVGMAASLGDVVLSGFVSIYFEKVVPILPRPDPCPDSCPDLTCTSSPSSGSNLKLKTGSKPWPHLALTPEPLSPAISTLSPGAQGEDRDLLGDPACSTPCTGHSKPAVAARSAKQLVVEHSFLPTSLMASAASALPQPRRSVHTLLV